MKISHLFAAAAMAATIVTPAFADRLPMDRPITINGITTVCTGIGEDARNDPRWKAYPVRVEFSNGAAQYLAGGHVVLKEDGQELMSIDCSGTWVLFQLPDGHYSVTASLLYHKDQPPRSASFTPPAHGQKRVVLEFSGVNPNE